jgi:Triose-phosphate Transporter family
MRRASAATVSDGVEKKKSLHHQQLHHHHRVTIETAEDSNSNHVATSVARILGSHGRRYHDNDVDDGIGDDDADVNGGGGGGGEYGVDPLAPPPFLTTTTTTTKLNGRHAANNNKNNNNKALPGRPKRKRTESGKLKTRSSRRNSSFCHRFYVRWIKGRGSSLSTLSLYSFNSVYLAVLLWYCLGVISIGTSKMLLMSHGNVGGGGGAEREGRGDFYAAAFFGGVPPLFLTLQQQVIGSLLLRFLLSIRFLQSSGLQPWPMSMDSTAASSLRNSSSSRRPSAYTHRVLRKDTSFMAQVRDSVETMASLQPSLVAAGIFFCLGFLATNHGFQASSASFVETIKASEPITSAMVAVWWGIEFLSYEECVSLGTIVAGVVLSTLGNSAGGVGGGGGGHHYGFNHHHILRQHAAAAATSTSHHMGFVESTRACLIVLASNLCFSFRGLYQKLFRATPEGSAQVLDDLNLQYRMQQIGTAILIIPVLIWDMPTILRHIILVSRHADGGLFRSGLLLRYIYMSLLNGFAFTGYNLASTYVLSRITVVHHAALNCVRRMFAIVVTSIIFSVPITFLGAVGILVSFGGFMAFTHYKIQRQRQPKPLSSLLPVSVVH